MIKSEIRNIADGKIIHIAIGDHGRQGFGQESE